VCVRVCVRVCACAYVRVRVCMCVLAVKGVNGGIGGGCTDMSGKVHAREMMRGPRGGELGVALSACRESSEVQ